MAKISNFQEIAPNHLFTKNRSFLSRPIIVTFRPISYSLQILWQEQVRNLLFHFASCEPLSRRGLCQVWRMNVISPTHTICFLVRTFKINIACYVCTNFLPYVKKLISNNKKTACFVVVVVVFVCFVLIFVLFWFVFLLVCLFVLFFFCLFLLFFVCLFVCLLGCLLVCWLVCSFVFVCLFIWRFPQRLYQLFRNFLFVMQILQLTRTPPITMLLLLTYAY